MSLFMKQLCRAGVKHGTFRNIKMVERNKLQSNLNVPNHV